MKKKESFILYHAFYEPIKDLPEEHLGKLLKAIFEYNINGSEPESNSPILLPFLFFKNQFKIDNEKYLKVLEVKRSNGSLGGRPKKAKKPTGYSDNQKVKIKAKKRVNDNDNDNVTVNGNVNETVNEIVLPFSSDHFSEVWLKWKKYKKEEHGFKYKSNVTEQTALKKLYELANGEEETALSIIENSVANGYKGLFSLPTPKNKKGGIDQNYLDELKNRLT